MPNFRLNLGHILVLLACIELVGCSTNPTPMYQWEGYQNNVDAYFRGNKLSLDTQTQLMEQDLQKIQANGGIVPPGYHAHLGLLYGQQGQLDQFFQQIQAERNQYPEAENFMNFLSRNFKQ